MKKRVIITGSCGFVGSAIYSKFLESGWDICTLGRNNESDVFCDFSSPMDIVRLKLPYDNFDLCIHVASANELICRQNPIMAYGINCCGTNALVELFKKYEVKQFFYISTFHVFGEQTGNLDENSSPIPNNLYGLTHRISELDLLMADMNKQFRTKIIRLPNIIGIPHKWSTFNRWTLAQFDFCKQCSEVEKISLNSAGDQLRNWVNLEFITDKINNLAQNNNDEKIHHIVGENLSIRQLAKIIAKEWELSFSQKIKIQYPLISKKLKIKNERNFSTINECNINKELLLNNFVAEVGLQLFQSKINGSII